MDFDVVVVGSGLVGASLALTLETAGLNLALIEAQPPQPGAGAADWDSRVYAISPGSAAFLERCGVWQELDMTRVSRVEAMCVFGDDGRSELDFSAYDAGLRELAFIVENRELQRVMWEALKRAQHVAVMAPEVCRALTFEAQAAQLELGDSRVLCPRLVVGADGADSWVRAQTAIAVEMRRYHQTAVVANFAITRPHRGTAYQWFRHDGVLALLPLPGERVSMVWSTRDEDAARLLELASEELVAQVAAASHGAVGDLQLITPAAAFPLRLQRVRQLVLPRLALVGDAAHNVHPLAGQGVNLGFRDARELAQVLMERGSQTDCGDYRLLRRYERARREDIVAMQFATDSLQRLFNNEITWLASLRNCGLRLMNRQPQLKNLLVQHAVG
ncbi:MAG: UbiH/UbiF family hydroxylase [Betaproteobacteria bacterium]|nr:UbiH/UbiF family hydroxylase [Betaproteobacteria bacterium]